MASSNKRRAAEISPPPIKRKVLSTTTSATVANFFKPLSQKEPEKTAWKVIDKSLLVAKYDDKIIPTYLKPRKVAAFDLDSTLIKTSSGRVFAKSESDWMWWDPVVPTKLKELYAEGYTVIIFTNQGGIKLDKPASKLDTFKLKVAATLSTLNIPLTLYGATENDKYRKPRVGMWDEMVDDYDIDIHGVNKEESFLVGDAAGRDGDFSASDRYFAFNVGIKFHTPEEYFLGHQPKPVKDLFNPMAVAAATVPASDPAMSTKFSKVNDLELVVLVGSPGAGKSTFVKRYLAPLGYERVNQDILKTREKCLKAASEYLQAKKCVVVDATNADTATRKEWIELAKKYTVPIRCIYLGTPQHICQHNDAVRAFGGDIVNPEKRKVLPRLAFTGYASRFNEPTLDEGFLDITKVEFEWEGNEMERNIWAKYWS